ncbi:hypothetical protein E4U22_006767 [Claviceps purpurea]|uniref:Mitochondrial ATP synthase subunit f n=2 Tax=Claviceps TaxID=5110 RepID=A0A9P7QAV6_9HYPO|nr:hypothetical protein E4U59_006007 [Claviceps monticola]KAG5992494.1 hypothetical protein E4U52_002773 [Claviceps spartinae]KAG6021124.1 hypothetical protein E4U19_005957 [Claviceps sp. Clav32 group G5]KAG6064484.1 hypothetical protein E4U32_000185 [Claviceps aff. humidiphila group G2b]KAG6073043.1 hypothetical protein E4U15_006614 [Claviceps sp. LM218 group G6]KAG6091609.1 hypothetical protein E4U30_006552 [Claviceps sp. LM220 group G6]KAG6105221.1 hypothetical protein E4U31_001507 [Clavic
MSFVTRRALSTLIPPKIACPKAIGCAPDALRMQRVMSFYENLPRGPAPVLEPTGFIGRYRAKHFGDKPTAKPFIHLLVFLVAIGYAQNYYFHLRHHKNNAH